MWNRKANPILPAVIAVTLVLAVPSGTGAIEHAGDTAEQNTPAPFERALRAATSARPQRMSDHLFVWEINRWAQRLAGELDMKSTPFLREKVRALPGDSNARKLAVLTLVAAEGDGLGPWLAEEAGGERANRAALLGVSYLGRVAARHWARHLAIEAEDPYARADAAQLFGAVGDAETLRFLMTIRVGAMNAHVRKALGKAIRTLRSELTMRQDESRAEWNRLELAYWRARHDEPPLRSVEAAIMETAKSLAQTDVRFPESFLRLHLREGEPLAAAIAGVQRTGDLFDELEYYLADLENGIMGAVARRAMLMVNTERALRAFEKALAPGDDSTNQRLAWLLGEHGDAQTLGVLREAESHEEYGETVLETMREARQRVMDRLQGEGGASAELNGT